MTYSYRTNNSHADNSNGSQSPFMNAKEKRSKRERDRYARMADEKKQEQLKRRREAYQQKKAKKEENSIGSQSQVMNEKERKSKIERDRYARMTEKKNKNN